MLVQLRPKGRGTDPSIPQTTRIHRNAANTIEMRLSQQFSDAHESLAMPLPRSKQWNECPLAAWP